MFRPRPPLKTQDAAHLLGPRSLAVLGWMIAAVMAAGCGGAAKEPIKTHQVTGQVYYLKKPAEGIKVYLLPVAAPVVPDIPANPRGVTGPDGTFKISTFAEDDGAPEGRYQVLLFWPPGEKDSADEGDEDKLLGWYDAINTKITARIKPGENVLPPIEIPKIKGPPDGGGEGVRGRN